MAVVTTILGFLLIVAGFAVWTRNPSGSFLTVLFLISVGYLVMTQHMKSKWGIIVSGLLLTAATFGMRYLFLLMRP